MRAPIFLTFSFAIACSTSAPDRTAVHVPAAASQPAASAISSPKSKEGNELLGTTAHAWTVDHWLNSAPLQLADLRGRVVLLRWFMSTECPLCTATAPSLRAFDADYRARGLTVVGFYHHKGNSPLDPADVQNYAHRYGYTFPVATDTDWRTLDDWWLDGHTRAFTSVSFLIDKRGIIRFIHPGGKYEPGSADAKELRTAIEALLLE